MRREMLFDLLLVTVVLMKGVTVEAQKIECRIDDPDRRLIVLNQALTADDATCAKRILDSGVDPNGLIDDRPGTAPILIASEVGNVEILEALFKAGVHRGEPPTLEAFFALIQMKNLDGVTVFIKAGVPVNLKGKSGETPLMVAVSLGEQKIASYLLEKGADPNAKTVNGVTVLMSAGIGSGDDPELLKLLLKAGAKVNAVSQDQRNAAFFALESCNLRKFEYLLRSGIDSTLRDSKGRTLRQLADEIKNASKKSEALEIISRFKDRSP